MEAVPSWSSPTLPALVTAVLLLNAASSVFALQCYECSEQPVVLNPNKTKPCSLFDGSWDYVVDCPHSTYCRKVSVELALPNGKSIRSIKRDCAPQLHSFQVLQNNEWKQKNETDTTIYKAGCSTDKPSGPQQPTTPEYCYCSSHLCNSGKGSHDTSYTHHTDAMAVIFVFNAMKYIRSLR